MTEFIMIGVMHEVAPDMTTGIGLMDAPAEEQFRLRVASKITDQSVVFLEGRNLTQLLRPNMPGYAKMFASLNRVLVEARPALGGADPRWDVHPQKSRRRKQVMLDWLAYVQRTFHFPHFPSSMEEAEEMVRANEFEIARILPAEPDEQEWARHIYMSMRRFNRSHVEWLRKVEDRFDTCVVVTGLVHAMSLSVLTSHRLENLLDERHHLVNDIYANYAAVMHLPQVLLELEQRPAA